MIMIILLTKSSMKPTTSEAIQNPVGNGSNYFDLVYLRPFPNFDYTNWSIVSPNESKQLVDNIKNVLQVSDF